MPIRRTVLHSGKIPIPKDQNKLSFKIIITDSAGTPHDVTNYIANCSLSRVATAGLSNFSLTLDNNGGRYRDVFDTGDSVDFYYNYTEQSSLSVIRCRCYIDNTFLNMDDSEGYTLTIDGRDSPISDVYEHFKDTHITIQFAARNNLDCWFGTTGTADSEGNYPDGILYNSDLILKVYDTSDSTWKVYKDLNNNQRDALKAISGYTQTNTFTYVEKDRLSISNALATEGDYEFRIFYDSSDGKTYLMVQPEESVINTSEHVTLGQNLIRVSRFGKDTTKEYNRIKEKGEADGSIISMRTKEDTARQAAVWIKDYEESSNSISTDTELAAKATARLSELKEAPNTGSIVCCGLPSLQPGEMIPINIPYGAHENYIVKSFTVTNFVDDLEFSLELKRRETTFERLFKDRIDDTVNITPTNNPNGMENALIYDFTDSNDYTLSDCQIVEEVLSLESGKTTGTCTTDLHTADSDITQLELRIKASQHWNSTYEATNDGGNTWETITRGALHTFTSTGNQLKIRVTLNESTSGVSPEFDKICSLYL